MRRHSRRPLILLLSAVVILICAFILLQETLRTDVLPQDGGELPIFYNPPSESPQGIQETQTLSPTPAPSVSSEPSDNKSSVPTPVTSEPVRILIPAIGTDAEIIGTERDEKANSMAIYPSATVLSWYKMRPIPGNDGNAILAGHNKWNGKKGVIADLGELEIGDEMSIIYEDGSERLFYLESVFEYELKTAPSGEIMRGDGPARVTIITCSGKYNKKTGTSENRLVAVFKPSEVFITPEPPVTPIPALGS